MSTRVADRVDDWDERSFAGGYRALHDLADEEFSGVIRAGGAELFMTKGVVVAIQRGDIEDFEEASGTAYEAPSPALPLLAIMQEESDEVRAQYYTEKTSISEVDSTLSDGGFTGYVELSENVLSGDYYLVYHAGRSMSVGFVGESKRLIDGDEAFETADDEVGIYEVRQVDIDPIEIPDPPEPTTDQESEPEPTTEPDSSSDESEPAVSGEDSESGDAAVSSEDTVSDEREPVSESKDSTNEGESSSATDTTEEAEATNALQSGTTVDETGSTMDDAGSTTDDAGSTTDDTGTASDNSATTRSQQQRPSAHRQHQSSTGESRTGGSTSIDRQEHLPDSQGGGESTGSGGGSHSASSLDLETRAIPSLDPERTQELDDSVGGARGDSMHRTRDGRRGGGQSKVDDQSSTPATSGTDQSASEPFRSTGEGSTRTAENDGTESGTAETVDTERIEELEAEIERRDEEIERLESELGRKTTEYEDAQEQLEAIREERDELLEEIEQLEGELERLETELGAATDAERRMTRTEALSGTDIFIRYQSKGDATLEKAHEGGHRREDVNGNLRLEKHTQFEAQSVSVGGQTYPEFLEGTLEYQFVEWTIRELLFEIRDTGHETELRNLYDALPNVDRAELAGVVDVVYSEDGQETRTQESFDVILRNRMGNPLLVANLNDSREAATESMMEDIITAAERVGQSSDEFAGAFLVTRSFFEPGALETASDATRGGLLSRDKRKSFVNLSRKRGYHLCLVEARNENFHLAVPEL